MSDAAFHADRRIGILKLHLQRAAIVESRGPVGASLSKRALQRQIDQLGMRGPPTMGYRNFTLARDTMKLPVLYRHERCELMGAECLSQYT